MTEYTPQVLRQLWDVEKEIYHTFARICDKHGLRYFAAYGTALGAVRHGGFIPWDDDMDFGMPRADYEKFMQVAPRELDSRYALLEPRTTPGYVMPFAKLTRADSTFIEATDQDRAYHSGIFIDIFPFDPIYPDEKRQEKVLHKCWVLARLMVLSTYRAPKLPAGTAGWKAALLKFACGAAHYALRLTGNRTEKLYRRYLDVIMTPAREGVHGLYADALQYRYEINYGPSGIFFADKLLFPTTEVPFDGETIAMPHDPAQYLTDIFGDYMQLPPENKRHAHTPAVLKFPASAGEPADR